MKRISLIVLSLMLICLSAFSASAVDYRYDGETVSDAVYLENLNTGVVVYEKNADQRSYPASTTKIMTFIITAENVSDLDRTDVTIRQEVLEGLDPESTVMGLSEHVGEQVSVRDLLYGLMLPSGNDAALVLADYTNPHGLYDPDHYTTARDMALITRHAMTIPDFMEICNTVYYTPEGFSSLHNTNFMLDPDAEGGMYYYPYTKGIKTGYLDEAGKCLVTSSDKDGDQYLCVCLGASYSFTENVNYAMKDTANLYEWAYENLGVQTIYSPSDSVSTVDVKYVRNGKTLSAVPEKAIAAFLPKNYDKSKLKVDVSCAEQVEAPVTKGAVLGSVSVKYEDLDLGVTKLVAAEDVARNMSPFEVFVTEHIVILSVALVLLVLILIILLSRRSARKRRKARQRARANRSDRYRD